MEMICAIVHQLTKNLTAEELQEQGFAPYYVDHTIGLWPQAASGEPWSASMIQSTGDPIADLHEDMGAEQKARLTYDKILRLIQDSEPGVPSPSPAGGRSVVFFRVPGPAPPHTSPPTLNYQHTN